MRLAREYINGAFIAVVCCLLAFFSVSALAAEKKADVKNSKLKQSAPVLMKKPVQSPKIIAV